MKASNKGFSLLELLVVISIIGVLVAAGMTSYRVANQKARDGKRKADLEQVRSALELHRTAEGDYPGGNWDSMINALYAGEYLSTSEVKDPGSDSDEYGYTYSNSGNGYWVCAKKLDGDDCNNAGPGSECYCVRNP